MAATKEAVVIRGDKEKKRVAEQGAAQACSCERRVVSDKHAILPVTSQ